MIRCPTCRFVQSEAPRCIRCGLIFTRLEARRLQTEEEADEPDAITDTFSTVGPVSGPNPETPRTLSDSWAWRTARTLLLLIVLPAMVGAVVVSSMTVRLHRTDAYATVSGFLHGSDRLGQEVGAGVDLGWWSLGKVEADHDTGTAVFVVPVAGPEGIGRVGATLVKAYGRWEVASAGFIWPSGREVVLAGNGWTDGERVPPCPRDIAAFRFTAAELLMQGEEFRPGSAEFSEQRPAGAPRSKADTLADEPPTPDRRPLYRKLSAREVLGLLPSEEVKLGDAPPLWREQKLLTESQEAMWLRGAPLKPTDLVLRRGRAGKPRAAGYLAAAWLDGVEGYEEAALEWVQARTPLVVYFRADWCPQCRDFEQRTLKAPRVREAFDRMVKVRVNPETSDDQRRLADAWRVEGYPAVFVLSPDGEDPVAIATHRRDPGGVLRFPEWMLQPADDFLDRVKEAVAEK